MIPSGKGRSIHESNVLPTDDSRAPAGVKTGRVERLPESGCYLCGYIVSIFVGEEEIPLCQYCASLIDEIPDPVLTAIVILRGDS